MLLLLLVPAALLILTDNLVARAQYFGGGSACGGCPQQPCPVICPAAPPPVCPLPPPCPAQYCPPPPLCPPPPPPPPPCPPPIMCPAPRPLCPTPMIGAYGGMATMPYAMMMQQPQLPYAPYFAARYAAPYAGGCSGGCAPAIAPPPAPVFAAYPAQNDCCCGCASPCRYSRRRAFAARTADQSPDPACNSQRLATIMREAMNNDTSESKRAIQKEAQQQLGGKFDVVCGKGEFSYIAHTDLFCQLAKGDLTCYAFQPI